MSAFQRTSEAGGSDEGREQVHGHLDQEQTTDAGEIAGAIFEWLETKDPKSFNQDDEDALNRMLAELEQADPEPDEEDIEASLADFHLKFAPLFEKAEVTTPNSEAAVPAPASEKRSHPLRKQLTLIAAVLALAFVLMVPARAAVFEFLDFIARSTAEIFRFDRGDTVYAKIETCPIAEGEETTYATLQDALDAFGIVAPLAPKRVPERFGEPTVTATNTTKGIRIFANYDHESEFLRVQYIEFDGRDLGAIEKDSENTSAYRQGKLQHFILFDQGIQKITWQNGVFECYISGTFSEQEAKDIINSIYE